MRAVDGYIRAQATVAGVINALLNPAIDWLTAPRHAQQPIWGADALVVNFVITSLILSTLVGAFASWGVRRETRAGRLCAIRRPRLGWVRGLSLGAAAAVVVTAVGALLHGIGVTTMPFIGLLLVKAAYCGLLGFLVARLVILHYLR